MVARCAAASRMWILSIPAAMRLSSDSSPPPGGRASTGRGALTRRCSWEFDGDKAGNSTRMRTGNSMGMRKGYSMVWPSAAHGGAAASGPGASGRPAIWRHRGGPLCSGRSGEMRTETERGSGIGWWSPQCYSGLRDGLSLVDLRSSIWASLFSPAESPFQNKVGSAEMAWSELTNNK
jgi:hypothetical protein